MKNIILFACILFITKLNCFAQAAESFYSSRGHLMQVSKNQILEKEMKLERAANFLCYFRPNDTILPQACGQLAIPTRWNWNDGEIGISCSFDSIFFNNMAIPILPKYHLLFDNDLMVNNGYHLEYNTHVIALINDTLSILGIPAYAQRSSNFNGLVPVLHQFKIDSSNKKINYIDITFPNINVNFGSITAFYDNNESKIAILDMQADSLYLMTYNNKIISKTMNTAISIKTKLLNQSLIFSPDGKSMAITISNDSLTSLNNVIFIYNTQNYQQVQLKKIIKGVEKIDTINELHLSFSFESAFSSNSKYFYCSVRGKNPQNLCQNRIYQIPINALDSIVDISTLNNICNHNNNSFFAGGEGYENSSTKLLKNGKIYLYQYQSRRLSFVTIENPNDPFEDLEIKIYPKNIVSDHGFMTGMFQRGFFPNNLVTKTLIEIIKHGNCVNANIEFEINSGYKHHFWNFGDGKQDSSLTNSAKHFYQKSGNYKVVCMFKTENGWDSVVQIINIKSAPPLYLPSDTLIFSTDSLIVKQINYPAIKYRWNDGDSGVFKIIKNVGKYIVTAADSLCIAKDSFVMQKVGFSIPDISLCTNQNGIFSIATNADSIWHLPLNNNIKDTLHVFNMQSIPLRIFKNGLFADTMLYPKITPLPVFSLGNDTLLCSSTSHNLSVFARADSVKWSDGYNTPTRPILKTDSYIAQAFSEGCAFSDTANIAVLNCSPTFKIDCLDSIATFNFDTQFTGLQLNINGNFDTSVGMHFIAFKFKAAGIQTLNWQLLKDSFRAQHQMELDIKPCQCTILIPNAFSPNGDHINDFFEIFSNCSLSNLQMEVYNAWGQKLYENKTGAAWNGTYNNTMVQEGNYLYFIQFKDPVSGRDRALQGRLLLLK